MLSPLCGTCGWAALQRKFSHVYFIKLVSSLVILYMKSGKIFLLPLLITSNRAFFCPVYIKEVVKNFLPQKNVTI